MTSLYVTQKRCEIERLLSTDFLQNKDLECHEYTDSYILPCRRIQSDAPDNILRGGVCSKDFTFIAGLTRRDTAKDFNFNIIEGYKLTEQEIEKAEEIDECIFGGTLITLFGHFIVESLSRLWFLDGEKTNKNLPILFIRYGVVCSYVEEMFEILGIKDRVRIINKPVRAKKVYVPDQSNQIFKYVNKEYYRKIFDIIKKNVGENPNTHNKIYLTRTKLKNQDCLGEEYFEEVFKELGFHIISPEQMSLKEQVQVISSADEIVCTLGTLSHFAVLFCKDNAKLTYLLRDTDISGIEPQAVLDNIKDCDISYVDISYNFLLTTHAKGIFLLYPTDDFKRYLTANNMEVTTEYDASKYIMEYIIKYTETYSKYEYPYKRLKNTDFFDFINNMSKVFLNKNLSRDSFKTPPISALQKKLSYFDSLTVSLAPKESTDTDYNDILDIPETTILHVTRFDDHIKINDTPIELDRVIRELKIFSSSISKIWGSYLPILYIGLIYQYQNYNVIVFDNAKKEINFSEEACLSLLMSQREVLVHRVRLNSTILDQYQECHSKSSWDCMIKYISEYEEYKRFPYFLTSENFLFDSNIFIIKKDSFTKYFDWMSPLMLNIYNNLIISDKKFINNISERINTLYFFNQYVRNSSVLSFDDKLIQYKKQRNSKEKQKKKVENKQNFSQLKKNDTLVSKISNMFSIFTRQR